MLIEIVYFINFFLSKIMYSINSSALAPGTLMLAPPPLPLPKAHNIML